MSEIFYSKYRLESDTEYFLYIGELKNYGLNGFLAESLSRIYQRNFDFIAIVPDVFEHYDYRNILVINPYAENFFRKHGCNICCRLAGRDFMKSVSRNSYVQELIRELLKRQKNVYIYMYESLPEMTLDKIPGVSILGPKSEIAHKMNSKITQYSRLSQQIPMPEYHVCPTLYHLIETTNNLWHHWTDGIFVTEEYSAAGAKSIVAHKPEDVIDKFKQENQQYLVSRFMPHEDDPTVLAVVANENEVYIAGVADQRIEQGNRFTGSTYPSKLSPDIINRLGDLTRTAGKWLATNGYRGIFGCDYIVTDQENIYFLEINARKQGTTMEFCCTLEQCLPDGSPMLPELEYWAVTHNHFPEHTIELTSNPKNIHWGTYNFKMQKMVRTNGYIPQSTYERETFKKVAGGFLSKDHIILEHIGNDFVVAQGTFIGRIVALGHDSDTVQESINQGLEKLQMSFCDETNPEIIHE
ncbi:MAG: ATP-grasp domain-containing protein [Desulfobacterales bacterium]